MGLIKEPKEIDFSTKSEPWTENELGEFRQIMKSIKEKSRCDHANNKSHIYFYEDIFSINLIHCQFCKGCVSRFLFFFNILFLTI